MNSVQLDLTEIHPKLGQTQGPPRSALIVGECAVVPESLPPRPRSCLSVRRDSPNPVGPEVVEQGRVTEASYCTPHQVYNVLFSAGL